jgi:hypothetical protein
VRKEMVTTKSSRCSKDDKIRGLIRTEYSEGTGSNETEYGKSEGCDGNIVVKFKNYDMENDEGSKETLWERKGDGKV